MEEEQNRREFLRRVVRGAGLVGLSGLCGVLVADARNGGCVRTTVCGGCPAFSGCRLPKAQTARDLPSAQRSELNRTQNEHG